MTDILLIAVLIITIITVLLQVFLLTRRLQADPGFGAVQIAFAQHAVQLGALAGTIRAELTQQSAELAREFSGFTIEQTKLLNLGLNDQRSALAQQDIVVKSLAPALSEQLRQNAEHVRARMDAMDKALMQQLLKAMEDNTARGIAQRDLLVQDAVALRRDLAQGVVDMQAALVKLYAAAAESQASQAQISAAEMAKLRDLIDLKSNESRDLVDLKLREMREANDLKLAEMQKTVNEQLQTAVEKQMNESFTRVIDQFTAIQTMMGNVQAVASQVGDLKRLFGNVKARGGWGEGQVRALLEDILPAGTWDTNVRLREDSLDVVEFTVNMPVQGSHRAVFAVDAKFPTEDYDRILLASDAADIDAERSARMALERRIRAEAKSIATKYICPPRTVEFAVMYLPNDGLYAEVARIPGLTDEIGRIHRVFVLGPSLLPAMLRTIQLGHVSLALSANAEGVRDLLAATKSEMLKIDNVLARLGKQIGTVSGTIDQARTRTRQIGRKLKGVDAMDGPAAEVLLDLTVADALDDDEE